MSLLKLVTIRASQRQLSLFYISITDVGNHSHVDFYFPVYVEIFLRVPESMENTEK